jgi:hypothetical protein
MGDLSDFEKGQIVGVCLIGEFATKTATLLGVSRVTVLNTNHGRQHQKRNSGQKST